VNAQFEDAVMSKRLLPVLGLLTVSLLVLHDVRGQDVKSGPPIDKALPGSFPPLNINGEFKDRHHCLVCQFRINPVVMMFVRQTGDSADPEVKSLIEAMDKMCKEHYADFGLSSFVVFLTPGARSSVTQEVKSKDVKDTTVISEAQLREKLVVALRKDAASSNKVIWSIFPADGKIRNPYRFNKDDPEEIELTEAYKLSENAEVTVILYYRHNVMYTYAFGKEKLSAAGVEQVRQGVEKMLERVKKGPGGGKKVDAGK
jgi:hypothetical protein